MRHCLTITGADHQAEPGELAVLSEQYPFVEWGILWSAARRWTLAGEPGMPTSKFHYLVAHRGTWRRQ